MGSVAEFTDANFDQEVLQSSEPVLVDFWAPWCGPCRMIAPVVEQLAAENSGSIKIGKVNVDNSPQAAERYGVSSIPTLLIFKSGQVVKSFVGMQPKGACKKPWTRRRPDERPRRMRRESVACGPIVKDRQSTQDGDLKMGSVVEFTDGNFGQEVLQSTAPVLVDFWAPWCPPCRAIAPVVEQLAVDNAGSIKIGKVNVDVSPQAAEHYGVGSIPTLLIFKSGKVVKSFVGMQPKGRLQEALDAVKS